MYKGKTIDIRYVGSRFDGGRLPLEVLSDLPAFRELLLIFAKEKWRSLNPGRRRLPKGFEQSISYDLVGISSGSAVVHIAFGYQPQQGILPGLAYDEDLIAPSCKGVTDLIRSASDLQSLNTPSPAISRAVNRIGSWLSPNERIEIKGIDGNVAILDVSLRKRLVTTAQDTYTRRSDGIGILSLLDMDGYIAIRTVEYGKVRFSIDPDRINTEFRGSFGSPVQFSLLIELDAKDRYKSVKEVYEVELIDPERSDSVMNCMDKLTELRQLEDGWLDGLGTRPTDDATSSVELFLNERPDLASKFRIYPMEDGGVSIEFEHDGWGLSLEFRPDGRVEIFGVEIDGPGEIEPTLFERVDELFLKEFDKRTGR